MAVSTRPPRTLSDIKTHSGRVRGDNEIYRDYFQVGALELERLRRNKEREAASQRIAIIDNRVADIEKEKELLLASAAKYCESLDSDADKAGAGGKNKPSGFRIKY